MKQLVPVGLVALFLAMVPLTSATAQTIDKPVAMVNLIRPEVYSLLQYKADLQRIEQTMHTQLSADQKRQFLDSQVDLMLFKQYCDREKIIVSDAEVNQQYLQLKSQLGPSADDAAVDNYFRSQGIPTDAKAYIKQQMLFARYIQLKKADEVKTIKAPTSDDVLKEYELQKAKLIRPDSVRLSVVYVDLRGKTDADKAKGRSVMQAIADKLKADPSSFDGVMLKGLDPSSGYRASSSLTVTRTPEAAAAYGQKFIDMAFALKTGEISPLLEDPSGFQIIRVNEVLPQKQLTLSDPIPGQPNATVQDLIINDLTARTRAQFLKNAQDELIAQLRKQGTVKIYDQNLNS